MKLNNKIHNIKYKKKIILELKGISKFFLGVKALDKANLRIYEGQVTALIGENGAGKSTIMNIIFGIHKSNEGKIIYKNKEIKYTSPKQAMSHGISMVHQELNQINEASVVDNIWLGRYPTNGMFLDKHKALEQTKKIFKKLNININPHTYISKLSISQKQMVEIAKAISYNSKILILDEPTSSLTKREVHHLFGIIRNLKKLGVGILFVSHKMEEINEIADYVTVFRDGKFISETHISKTTFKQVIKDMVGREMKNQYPQKTILKNKKDILLKLKNLSSKYDGPQDINLHLKKGEILGIAGLVGSKRSELLELLFGTRTKSIYSQIIKNGQNIYNKSPQMAMKKGFAMVTEERKEDGIFPNLSIEFNTIIAQLNIYKGPSRLFLKKELMKQDTNNMIKIMSTKTPSLKTHMASLSGGNQQKVILSRWLLRQPDILLLDEPTRGIDVGAKYQIYELIQELVKNGDKSIVMVSSEISELLGTCHRIAIMSNSKLAGVVNANTTTQEEIMKLVSKYY